VRAGERHSPPTRPWTLAGLVALRAVMADGGSLDDAADALGRDPADCNIALDSLIGRALVDALLSLSFRTLTTRKASHD